MLTCRLVVPCYNEAERLDVKAYEAFLARHEDMGFLFVNDGSTDETAKVLASLVNAYPTQVAVHALSQNQGKGEAVRQGLRTALGDPHLHLTGYWDADLATPLSTILDMRAYLDLHPQVSWVLGSRVRLLGRAIHRTMPRHYAARVFATAVSMSLRLEVYDSQCGAKLFRANEGLNQLLAEPFISRWIFDVELLARYKQHLKAHNAHFEDHVHEFPLTTWADVYGSRLVPSDFVKAGVELARINARYRKSLNA